MRKWSIDSDMSPDPQVLSLGPLNIMSHARLSVYVPTVLKAEGDRCAVVSVDKIDIHKSST